MMDPGSVTCNYTLQKSSSVFVTSLHTFVGSFVIFGTQIAQNLRGQVPC